MAIYLDTSIVEEIVKYHNLGIVRGVTTNPTIMKKDGLTGGMNGVRRRVLEICEIMAPQTVSVEVMTNDPEEMLSQAREYASWADNVIPKITIHGPYGETDNLRIANELETKHNIRVNVTAMMSAQQCLLAAFAGATYVSIFGGRVNNMGYNACGEIRRLRTVLDSLGLKSKIIVGSTREVLNIIEWLEAGAHIVTVTPNLLDSMLVHPYSKETVQMFLSDAGKLDIS